MLHGQRYERGEVATQGRRCVEHGPSFDKQTTWRVTLARGRLSLRRLPRRRSTSAHCIEFQRDPHLVGRERIGSGNFQLNPRVLKNLDQTKLKYSIGTNLE